MRFEVARLQADVARLREWKAIQTDESTPPPVEWRELLGKFQVIEKELRSLSEQVAEAYSLQMRHYLAVPSNLKAARTDPARLPTLLSQMPHPDILAQDKQLEQEQAASGGTGEGPQDAEEIARFNAGVDDLLDELEAFEPPWE